jgi:hypothetical protein
MPSCCTATRSRKLGAGEHPSGVAAAPGGIDGVPYLTHVTAILFAALDIALARSSPNLVLPTSTRSSSAFLQHNDANKGIRLAFDDYAAHKHPKIENRLPARPCAHIHHAPIYAFCLDQVERWFALSWPSR